MSHNFNIRNFLDCENMTEEEINRCEFWIMANRIVCETGKANYLEAKIPVNNTWDLNLLEKWLEGYHDNMLINYLRYGWPLNVSGTEENTNIPCCILGHKPL